MTPDDFVYVIAMNDQRHKIGISKQPAARVAQLQTGHPEPLQLIYLVKTNRARVVEGEAHRRLAKWRLQGEWFAVGAETAIAAVNRADTRYPSKDVPLSKRAAKWAAQMEEVKDGSSVALKAEPVSIRPVRVAPAITVSLPFGPTERKPGSMLKNR